MSRSPVPSMPLAAKGANLVLKPAGFHVMLIDLMAPLRQGDLIELNLYVEQAGIARLMVPVLAP